MRYLMLIPLVLLVGCETVRSTKDRWFGGPDEETEPVAAEQDTPEIAEPETVAEPVAAAPAWDGARRTVASLGDPTRPGRWMETPLVESQTNGRIVVRRTGAQAYVVLQPAPGVASAGSRLSLDAMRELLVPFDELVELDVYSD